MAVSFLNPYRDSEGRGRSKKERLLVVRDIVLDGPYNAPAPKLPESHRRLMAHAPGLQRARGRPGDRHAVRHARLPPAGQAGGGRALPEAVRQGREERRALREARSVGPERRPRLAALPVPRRAGPGRRQGRHGLRDQRIRAGQPAVVLPLEQHAGRRAVRPGGQGRAAARTSTPRCGGCSRTRSPPPSSRTSPASG